MLEMIGACCSLTVVVIAMTKCAKAVLLIGSEGGSMQPCFCFCHCGLGFVC